MPWIRIDDHFDEHPKLAAVGPVGWGVWLAGLAYCNRNLTDGFIPYAIAEGIGGGWLVRVPVDDPDDLNARREGLEQVWHIGRTSGMGGEDMTAQWVIDLLLYYGVWEQVRGGYRVHDYEHYQPTRAQVEAERATKAAAGRAGGIATATARGAAPAKAKLQPVPNPVPNPTPVPGTGALSRARENGEVPMNPERAQSILDDPEADPEAKEGAKAYLELRSKFGRRGQPSRIGA